MTRAVVGQGRRRQLAGLVASCAPGWVDWAVVVFVPRVDGGSAGASVARGFRALVDAPFGYGRSAHVQRLLDGQSHVMSSRDPEEVLAALTDSSDGAVVVASDVGEWRRDDQLRLGDVLTFRRPAASVLAVGQGCDRALHEAFEVTGSQIVGTAELRLSETAVAARLAAYDLTGETVRSLTELIDGWPALAAAIADHLERGRCRGLAGIDETVQSLVERCLRPLDHQDRGVLGELAHLDSIPERLVESISPGLGQRLRRAGVPLEPAAPASLRLLLPIRRTLHRENPLSAPGAARLVTPLREAGMGLVGVRLLIRTHQLEEAARLLIELPAEQVNAASTAALLGALDLLGPMSERVPRLWMVRARAHARVAQVAEQLDALDHAAHAARELGDERLATEAATERLVLDAQLGIEPDQLIPRVKALHQRTRRNPDSYLTARLLDVEVLVLANSEQHRQLEQARELSRRAVDAQLSIHHHSDAARSLRTRALTVLLPLGCWGEARTVLFQALALNPTAGLDRVSTLLLLLRVEALLADYQPLRDAEAAALANVVDAQWCTAYLYWARMIEAGATRRIEQLSASLEASWAMLGPLRDHSTGVVWRAMAAEALARCGDVGAARDQLARIGERGDEARRERTLAELAIVAHEGRPADVEQVLATAGHVHIAPWQITIARAVALARAGHDPEPAMRDALQLAPDGAVAAAIRAREPQLPWATLAPGPAATAGFDGRRAPGTGRGVRIRTLGCFEVLVDGQPVAMPSARVAQLFKVMALGRGRAVIDVVIDRLWPDVTDDIGRRRLRNVMTRARSLVGDVIRRDANAVVLDPSVEIDLNRFTRESSVALRELASGSRLAISGAIAALDHYGGDLFPDDLYDDVIAPLRLAEAERALALVDGIIAADPDPALAPRLFDAILTIRPDDIVRLERLARWAHDHGLFGVARSAATRIRVVADELELELAPRLAQFVSSVSASRFG